MSRHLIAVVAAAVLAAPGCTAVTPRGLAVAASFDPLGTAPDGIAAGVEVPAALRLSDGDVALQLSFTDDDGAVPVDEIVALELRSGLPGYTAGDGRALYAARIATSDEPRLARAQAEIRRLRAGGARGSGRLTISVTGGCLTTPLEDGLPLRTFLSVGGSGFVPLTRRRDLFDVLEPDAAEALRGRLAPCP